MVDVATRLVVALLPWHSGTADHPQAPKRPSRPPLAPTASQARAEAVQRPPGTRRLSDGSSPRHHAAVAADHRRCLRRHTTNLSRRRVKEHSSFSRCVTTNASTRLHHRLSSTKQRQRDTCCWKDATSRCECSTSTADEASLCLPTPFWPGVGSEIVCTAALCLCITCGGWPAAVEVWLL